MSCTSEAKVLLSEQWRKAPFGAITFLLKRNCIEIGEALMLLVRPRPRGADFKAMTMKSLDKMVIRILLYM